jgi:hypothetical protein
VEHRRRRNRVGTHSPVDATIVPRQRAASAVSGARNPRRNFDQVARTEARYIEAVPM